MQPLSRNVPYIKLEKTHIGNSLVPLATTPSRVEIAEFSQCCVAIWDEGRERPRNRR
jgi:hypothetical protein